MEILDRFEIRTSKTTIDRWCVFHFFSIHVDGKDTSKINFIPTVNEFLYRDERKHVVLLNRNFISIDR